MIRVFALALLVIATFASFGNNLADSVNVRFRVGQSRFDAAFEDNHRAMDSFIESVRQAEASGDIERIIVRGYASPDGQAASNEKLAHRRCSAIAEYIAEHAGVSRSLIEEQPGGVAWDELRRLVEADHSVPSREKVLYILDNTPLMVFSPTGKIIDGRKKQLMDLNGGRTYRWMTEHLFPTLRNAVAVTLYLRSDSTAEQPEDTGAGATELQPDTEIAVPDTVGSENLASGISAAEIQDPEVREEIKRRTAHFALKTNLLYDAALLPNLELEWFVNDYWSVSLEGDVAWWKPEYTRVYRMAIVSPEVRYHIRPRAPWHGMYVGAFAGGGFYQLENRHDGYRGEGGMGGVSFGYMWPVGKHLLFDAEIGAGYLYSRYKVYESRDHHKLYLRTKTLNYFGPLKLKFSIAWRFDISTVKKIKVSSTL
ncbi:MAG: DUF3575 domain-containing protein [Muribaculaceae bacterium]|nr:DUF3575 domain-containing protein [Muribaculaceae bacterium]